MINLLLFFKILAVDYGIFWVEDTFSFVEFYYSLPISSLQPERIINDTAFFSYKINFSLKGKINKKENIEKKIFLANYSLLKNLNKVYLDGFGLYLPLGKYVYQIEILGKNYQDSLLVKDFRNNTSLSNFIYLSSCGIDEKSGYFYRNGYYYTPNPEKIYNLDRTPIAYIYFEIYNLRRDTIFVSYQIFDEEGKLEKDFTPMKIIGRDRNLAKAIGVPLDGLSFGKKTLALILIEENRRIWEERKDFYLTGEKFTTFLKESLFSLKESLFYLLERNKKEKERYKKLTLIGKKKYLDNYFRTFDLDTLKARIEYVNLNYSHMKKKGVETDRGRIYLKYGEPEKKEIEIFGVDIRPYEYWYYSQTNYFYLFMDIRGDGDYLLLYTNDPKESNYPGYEKYLNYELMEKLGIRK